MFASFPYATIQNETSRSLNLNQGSPFGSSARANVWPAESCYRALAACPRICEGQSSNDVFHVEFPRFDVRPFCSANGAELVVDDIVAA